MYMLPEEEEEEDALSSPEPASIPSIDSLMTFPPSTQWHPSDYPHPEGPPGTQYSLHSQSSKVLSSAASDPCIRANMII